MARRTMGESKAARRRGRAQGRKSFELVSPPARVINDAEDEPRRSDLIIEKPSSYPVTDRSPVQSEAKKSGKTNAKLSASEHLAVRRASAHAFHRSPMMSSEDYTYVKRDLVRIAILSVFMVSGIVVLYLLFGL